MALPMEVEYAIKIIDVVNSWMPAFLGLRLKRTLMLQDQLVGESFSSTSCLGYIGLIKFLEILVFKTLVS